MPSPFPGMNPYLEQSALWQDFHTRFLVELSDELIPLISPRYFVLIERYVYIHEPEVDPPNLMRADLLVGSSPSVQKPGVALLEPEAPVQVQHVEDEIEIITSLEIHKSDGGDLITLVEFLSKANKREELPQYRKKRARILASPVHLVEIDLLRGGRPMPDNHRPPCDYSAMVSRAGHRPTAGFWPIGLKDRLPTIPIPLSRADADAHVDLQAILDHVYDKSRYELFIYRGKPDPPLSAGDAEWARAFVPAAR